MRCGRWLVVLFLVPALAGAAASWKLGGFTLTIGDDGRVTSLRSADGLELAAADDSPAFEVATDQGLLRPTAVQPTADGFTVRFGQQGTMRCTATAGDGFLVLKLVELKVPGTVRRLRLFCLPLPDGGTLAGLLNGWYDDRSAVAVMATEPNVQGTSQAPSTTHGDHTGCSHRFERVTDPVRSGAAAVRFTATSTRADNHGWSWGRQPFEAAVDLTGMTALRAWVHGDNSGAVLKLQLRDAREGARDDTLVLNFAGWKQVTLGKASYDTLRYGQVNSLNLYYNGLPAGKTATCVVDGVEALLGEGAAQKVVPLADFEGPASPLWQSSKSSRKLLAESYDRHGLTPAGVAVVACGRADYEAAIARCERAAGLPSPRPGGVWSKQSPLARQSYLLALNLTEADVDEVIEFARRGGLGTIMIFQSGGMWCATTGHYLINTTAWPRGLDSLKDACAKIHRAGLRVGFHYLGASVYPPDPYIAPVPDPRLVKDAFGELASDLDVAAGFIPLAAPPKDFPAKDVDYLGSGAVVQIGDELIHYTTTSLDPPYGLKGCSRGFHGTVAAAHAKGARVAHMQRSYGYYLYDMDTPILDEIADAVTRILNACEADMVYWDGSEQLQGDHWYYNAKLHRAFYDRLKNKDTLCQGSSVSHYSWHIHSRLASADGHGDLKGYLDERRPRFAWYRDNLLPVDIGWYSVFDTSQPLDAFEYILNKSLGYDASISFGMMPQVLRRHPYLNVIADRIAFYERVRTAGRVPEVTRAVLREPGRREYRLVNPAAPELQRVLYQPRHDVIDAAGGSAEWSVEVQDAPCRLAVELTVLDRLGSPGPAYGAPEAVVLEDFQSLKPYLSDADGKIDTMVIGEGKAGMTREGVTQRFELLAGGPGGAKYVAYTAVSTLADAGGWSAIGRPITPAVDMSKLAGVGLWLRGDGHGGAFKLQLRDEVGAADWYVANDFEGWRFIQLPFATAQIWRTLDWGKISRIIFYYNSLPAKSTVTCGIAGIRALPALDEPVLANPRLSVNGTTITWPATLNGAAWLFAWPGEPARVCTATSDRTLDPPPVVTLPPGTHRFRFAADSGAAMPAVGVKLMLLPPETLPAGARP